jgi:hypothetical protein
MLTDEHYAVEMMISQGAPFEHMKDYINTLAGLLEPEVGSPGVWSKVTS